MKLLTSLLMVAAVTLSLTPSLFSQGRVAKSPKEQLQAIKATNAKIMEQQAATLQKLDDLQKEAGQLRILTRRS